ncbi:hypothetical protein GCM10020216_053250 [Nonomuraea helvata]
MVIRPWRGRYAAGSVAVASRNEVWVAETGGPDDYAGAALRRWDGAAWRRVRKPAQLDSLDLVEDVAAADPGEVWGLSVYGQGYGELRVIHRDGSRWAMLPSPSPSVSLPQREPGWCENPSESALYLRELASRARNEVWSLARIARCGNGPTVREVVLHWNGTSWQEAKLPLDSTTQLTEIQADKVGGVWIGANPDHGQSYVLNFREGRWTRSTLHRGRVGRIVSIPGATGLLVLAQEGKDTYLIYELK